MPQALITEAVHTRLATSSVFTHIVTLLNRATGDEQSIHVETTSDRFVDVMREITRIRAEKQLFGYEVFEILDCNDPF